MLYMGVWPNLLISPHPDYVMTHRMVPLAPDRTYIECDWLFPPEALEVEGFDPSYAVEFWDITNWEDWTACINVQKGSANRGFRPGPLSPWETTIYQFLYMVGQAYSGQGVSAPPMPDRPNLVEASSGLRSAPFWFWHDSDGVRTPSCRAKTGRGRLHASAGNSDAPFAELVADDDPLDLGCSLPDPVDPEFAEEPLGHVFPHVAAAAENLDRPVGHPVGHLGCGQLGHRRMGVDQLDVGAGVDLAGDLVDHQAGSPQLGERVGQHELDGLVVGQFLSADDPLLGEAVTSSIKRSAAPQQRAAIIIRSNRNHSWAKAMPSPSSPTRCEAGTRTSSNPISQW